MQAAAARHAVERARLGEHLVAIDERPGVQFSLALGDALEASGGERFRGRLARGDAPRRLGGRELVQAFGNRFHG